MKRRNVLIALGVGTAVAATAAAHTVWSAGDDVAEVRDPMPGPAPATQDIAKIKPVEFWTGIFMKGWDYSYRHGTPLSRSADSQDHYDLAYDVDGCVAMFRATGQRRFLDRGLTFVENVVATAKPSRSLPGSAFNDSYLGWASSKSGEGGDEVPLYESYFWRYATSLLVAMKDQPPYKQRFVDLLDFAETHIFQKWYARGADDTIYRDRTHMAAHWALIATNLARLTTDTGRRTRYTTVADTISTRLRAQMRRNPAEPTAYFWSDIWDSTKRPGQDVGHGNGVITFVVESRDWTAKDMAAFSALLTKVIWPSGTTYHAYVDGTGKDNGWLADGFVKLGRYDPAVQLRLEKHQVVNDQFAANMALNARLLRS